jgi:hypothetical protein
MTVVVDPALHALNSATHIRRGLVRTTPEIEPNTAGYMKPLDNFLKSTFLHDCLLVGYQCLGTRSGKYLIPRIISMNPLVPGPTGHVPRGDNSN